jgi:hypothetical protein
MTLALLMLASLGVEADEAQLKKIHPARTQDALTKRPEGNWRSFRVAEIG